MTTYLNNYGKYATSSNLYRSYYPHRSRELVSPVCGIFINYFILNFVKLLAYNISNR